MEFRGYLLSLRRWAWLLIAGTLLAAAVGYVVTRQLPPVYEARATLLVNVSSSGGVPSYNDSMLSQQLVKTYGQMAAQPVVLEKVVQRLGLSESVEKLATMVSVQPVRDTQLFTILAKSSDPTQARDVANTTASVFIDQESQRLAQNGAANAMSVVQPALQPSEPSEPRLWVNVTLAALLGGLLAVGAVLLLDSLDDTVRTTEHLSGAVGLSTLGSVARLSARDGVRASDCILVPSPAHTRANEAYRLLRTSLDLAAMNQTFSTLLITSAEPGEGKSTTAANLALVEAQAGRRVVAVDVDLHRSNLHKLFGLNNERGLTTLLEQRHQAEVGEYLQPGPVPYLRVLTSGPLPAEPAELLQSSRFLLVLQELLKDAELVILDGPAVLGNADGLALAQVADAALVVVASAQTRTAALRRAVEGLQHSGTFVVGGVLNRHETSGPRDAGYFRRPARTIKLGA
jgi:polysaccharide biosynthesis transport protein